MRHLHQGLLAKYASHLLDKEKKMAAIDLYRKANKHTEVARLLVELARVSASTKVQPLRVKKLYVLAALEARFLLQSKSPWYTHS